jgi:hypothetical protein
VAKSDIYTYPQVDIFRVYENVFNIKEQQNTKKNKAPPLFIEKLGRQTNLLYKTQSCALLLKALFEVQ